MILFDKSRFRGSSQWKRKRAEILKRDHKQCKICGNKTGLQVHHILSISTHPQLRLDDNNLISVCTQCHENIHNNLYSQIYLTNLIVKK